MWIITVLAVILVSVMAAEHFKKRITDTLPLSAGCFVILLYLLAFFRALWLIDLLSAGILAGTGIILFRKKGREGLSLIRTVFLSYFPEILAILTVLILLTVSQLSKIATWWDDINFWATDAKALRALGGFAGKYGNAAPEFGDYPPAISLFKWFFLHMSPRIYREGLGFGGYLCMNYLFALPLLGNLLGENGILHPVSSGDAKIAFTVKRFASVLLGSLLLILLPTVMNVVCFQGTCADVTMGILYGTLLLSLWNDRENTVTEPFSQIRVAIYGSILVLTKSVGFEWAAFAFFFFLLTKRTGEKTTDNRAFLTGARIFAPWLLILLTEASWLCFCLLNRRVSKLTSAGIRIASSGNGSFFGIAKEKARAFFGGILFQPMHTDRTVFFDLSLAAFFLLLMALIVVFGIRKKYSGKTRNRLLIFTAVTALIAYGIIFLGHISIFAGETQYETAEVMAISISRYGAPFTVGMMILFLGILTEDSAEKDGLSGKGESFSGKGTDGPEPSRRAALSCLLGAVFILLTCDYPGVYEGLFGYRAHMDADLSSRKEMIDENGERFAGIVSGKKELQGKRILVLQDQDTVHWVHNAYLNLEVSPAAPVYESVNLKEISGPELQRTIESSHAAYIYAENAEDFPEGAFRDVFGEGLFPETVYRVTEDGKPYPAAIGEP
ncbi:MAG: hypothetical protein K6F53_01855 [Lachnospiraceae bacterium]|nr:hypothetical protein [Lachnospiraceae bacterium]